MYCLFAALDTNEKFSPIGTIHHNDKVTDMSNVREVVGDVTQCT